MVHMNFKITKSPGTDNPRDQAPTARSTDRVAKSTATGEGMTNADKQRLEFVLSRISAIYDELDEAERKLINAAKATPKQKPAPQPEPTPEPTPEPKPQARGMKAAVKLGRGQVDTTAGIRDRVKK